MINTGAMKIKLKACAMKIKLKACENYEDIKYTQDTTELLKVIKPICYNFQDVKYEPSEIH